MDGCFFPSPSDPNTHESAQSSSKRLGKHKGVSQNKGYLLEEPIIRVFVHWGPSKG